MHAAFVLWLTLALVGPPAVARTINIAADLSAMGDAVLVLIATFW